MSSKTVIVSLAVVAILLGTGIVILASDHDQESDGLTLVVGSTNEIKDFSIHDYNLGTIRSQCMTQSLLRFGSDGELTPLLATGWSTDDAQTWTFSIREDVTWHDGEPFTAEDVIFTLDYLRAQSESHRIIYEYIVEASIEDGSKVKLVLKEKNANLLKDLTSLRIIPKHIFKDVEDSKTYKDPDILIGTGPYRFVSYEKESRTFSMAAYDGYWGGVPAVKKIVYRFFNNEDTLMMAVKKGEVDLSYMYAKGMSYTYLPSMETASNIELMRITNTGVPQLLWFNTDKAPYNDAGFRLAISKCIDYEEVSKLMALGYGKVPNGGIIPPGTFGYKDTTKLVMDVQGSKAALEDLGFKDMNGDGWRENPDGTEFKPKIFTKAENTDSAKISELVVNYLKKVGINASVEFKESLGDILDQEKSHEMAITGTTAWGMKMWRDYCTGYMDKRQFGWTMTDEDDFVSIVDGLGISTSQENTRELAGDLQDWYDSNRPAIPLYWSDFVQPYNKRLSGFEVDFMYGVMSYGTFFNLRAVG